MDLTTIGIDVALVMAIIAAAKVITGLADPVGKFSRWYPLLPVILAIPVSVLRFWSDGILKIALMVFVYGFIAGHAYKTGKTTILGQ